MNRVQFSGYVLSATHKQCSNGSTLLNLFVVSSDLRYRSDGRPTVIESKSFFKVFYPEDHDYTMPEKGQIVELDGEIHSRDILDDDGNRRTFSDIVVDPAKVRIRDQQEDTVAADN